MDETQIKKKDKKKKKHEDLIEEVLSEPPSDMVREKEGEEDQARLKKKKKKKSKHKENPRDQDDRCSVSNHVGEREAVGEGSSKIKKKKTKKSNPENENEAILKDGNETDEYSDKTQTLCNMGEVGNTSINKKKKKSESDTVPIDDLEDCDRKVCDSSEDIDTIKHKLKKKKKVKQESTYSATETGCKNEPNNGEDVCTSNTKLGDEGRHKSKKRKIKHDEQNMDVVFHEQSAEVYENDSAIPEGKKTHIEPLSSDEVDLQIQPKKHKKKHRHRDKNIVGENVTTKGRNIKAEVSEELTELVDDNGKKKKRKKERQISDSSSEECSESKPLLGDRTYKTASKSAKSFTNDVNTVQHSADVGVGQWSSANLGDSERQNKFFRLLGGFKKGSNLSNIQNKFSLGQNRGINENRSTGFLRKSGGGFAMDKVQEEKYTKCMEQDYERAMEMNMNRGIGLGFEKPPDAGKKFYIDTKSSKSVKFDD